MCTNLFHRNRGVESVSGEEKCKRSSGALIALRTRLSVSPQTLASWAWWTNSTLVSEHDSEGGRGKLTYFSVVYLSPVRGVLSVEVYGVGTWHVRTWGTHLTKHFKYHTWRRLKHFPPSAFKIQGQLRSTHFGAERKHNILQLLGGPSSWTSCS